MHHVGMLTSNDIREENSFPMQSLDLLRKSKWSRTRNSCCNNYSGKMIHLSCWPIFLGGLKVFQQICNWQISDKKIPTGMGGNGSHSSGIGTAFSPVFCRIGMGLEFYGATGTGEVWKSTPVLNQSIVHSEEHTAWFRLWMNILLESLTGSFLFLKEFE